MNTRKLINFLAYLAVILICSSQIVRFLGVRVFNLDGTFVYWCDKIAFILSLIVTVTCAFLYAHSKRNAIFMIVLVILIIALIVLNFVV